MERFLFHKSDKYILTLSLFFALTTRVFSQTNVASEVDKIAIPFSLNFKDNVNNFEKFEANIIEKKIFALGEATHGTKEFFVVKDHLVRSLVSKMNVKSIVIEADFSGTLKINDFILYGKGDPKDALLSMKMALYNNQEFLDMVIWLRNYNSMQGQENKVHFYGCDMQTPTLISNSLLNGSIKTLQPISLLCKDGLRLLFLTKNQDLKKNDIILLQKTRDELATLKIIDGGMAKVEVQAIKTIIQAINLRLNIRNSASLRDEYMAKNCEWLYDFHEKSNMIIWAHNLHINKVNSIFKHKPMGQYLKEKYADEYYALGFGFGSGTIRASDFTDNFKSKIFDLQKVIEKNSSDYIFSQSSLPNFIIDFKSAISNQEMNNFLTKKVHSRTIGFAINPANKSVQKDIFMPLLSLYDGILFIRNTTAASEQLTPN